MKKQSSSLALLAFILLGLCCPTVSSAAAPTLSASTVYWSPTANVSSVKDTTAKLGATIDADGGQAITERGIVWSTTDPTPTIAEGATKVAGTGTATGVFSLNVTGLTKAARVYFSGYATNAGGTGYSAPADFWTESDPAPAPTVNAPTGTNYFNLTVNYTKPANADGVLVVVRQTYAPTKAPYDGTVYVANPRIGDGDTTVPGCVLYCEYVVANATASGSVTVTGLKAGTKHYFAVYAYKGVGGGINGINYVQTIAAAGPITTDTVPAAGRSHNEQHVATGPGGTETSTDCANCHNRHHTSQPLIPTGIDMHTKCFACHNPLGAAWTKINIGLHLADGSVDCGTCHSMHSFRTEELYSKNHAGVWGFNRSFIRANMSKYMNPTDYPPPGGGGTTTALDNTVFQDRATDFAFASADPDPDRPGMYNGVCQTCHTDDARTIHHQQNATDNHNIGTDCSTCHAHKQSDEYNAFMGGGHTDTQFAWAGNCDKCHSATPGAPTEAVVRVVHNNNCDLCHTTGGPYNAGTNKVGARGDGDATRAEGDAGTWTSTCITCHNNGTTIFTGGIHHDTATAANNNCTTVCHDGTKLVQNHSAVVASSASCVATYCHTSAAAGTATGISIAPDNLKHSACISCHTFDANKSGILRTAPGTKGVTVMSNGGDDSRLDATPNGGGDCIACHYGAGATAALRATSRVTFHHQNANTAPGNCDYCHYDHRPATGYSTANINAATGLDNKGGNVPTHLLCEECHVNPESAVGGQNNNGDTGNTRTNGYAGGNVTITAYNKGTDTYKTGSSWFTAPTKSTVHTVPNTALKIDNWGICISCHDGGNTLITGLVAPTVQPMHALPATMQNSNGDYCFDNGTVRGTYTNGKGAYLPGRRLYNAMSNINYFGDDWRPSSTRSNAKTPTRNPANVVWALDNGRCGRNAGQFAQITGAYKSAGRLWDNSLTTSLSEKLVPNPWTGVQYNNPYTTIRDQLPFFAAQTVVTDITPSYDIVSVTSATMSGGTLTVVSTVNNGNCTDLTLQTGAGNAAFNVSCQASIAYSYPTNGLTVNVFSAQPGVYVYNYPITP